MARMKPNIGALMLVAALGGAMAGLDPVQAVQDLARRPRKIHNNNMTSEERRQQRNKNKAAKKSRAKNKGR